MTILLPSDPPIQCSAKPAGNGRWVSQAKLERGFRRGLCSFQAKYEIGGKPLCRIHAEMRKQYDPR